jgi:type VI secretion system protein ImpB
MTELSCVMGVLADLSGRPDEPLPELRDRGFIEIDRDFLHEVLNRTKPHLAYQVANQLTDEDAQIGVDLRFSSMEDFDPAQVVQQVEPMRRLLVSVQVIDQAMPRDAGAAGAQRGVEARTVRARPAVSLHTRPSDSRGHCGVVA